MYLETAFLSLIIALAQAFPTELAASEYSSLSERAIGSACSTPVRSFHGASFSGVRSLIIDEQDGSGTCQQTTSCTTSGFSVAGYCPDDPDTVECCVVASCSTSSGSGICLSTADACSGNFVSGVCAGPSDIEASLLQRSSFYTTR